MGKDNKQSGGKGGKQAKDSGDKGDGKLKNASHVKVRHILNEKQGKILEAYEKMKAGWLNNGDSVPVAEFGKLAQEYSTCSSGKKGGDLGWIHRGKTVRAFEDVAYATPEGGVSAPFKSDFGWHVIFVEGRKNG